MLPRRRAFSSYRLYLKQFDGVVTDRLQEIAAALWFSSVIVTRHHQHAEF